MMFVITYDVRLKNHAYESLYDQLKAWGASHLQNSVWLLDTNLPAVTVRNTLQQHMHQDDTCCVIQFFHNSAWATNAARPEGVNFLKAKVAA